MNYFLGFAVLISCVLLSHQEYHHYDQQLRAVAILFRHGDRAPTSSFPKDTHFDKTHWPMGFGQLTNKGKMRLHALGKWLRKRYNGFLPETYSPEVIYVLSSDVERTISSAALVLAELYPPKRDRRPIPIHTRPTKSDPILAMGAPCPKYEYLYEAAKQSHYYRNISRKFSGLYELVSSYTGWEVDDVKYFAQLHTNFQCYLSANESWLPPWKDSLDQSTIEYLAAQSYARYTFTRKMKRLGDGPFFDYLFSFLDKIVANETEVPKFLMLSGHQDTIVSILKGLGLYDYLVPKFGAALIWELYEDASGHHIDLLYRRDHTQLDELELANCEKPCFYNHFKGNLADLTVNKSTWERECLI